MLYEFALVNLRYTLNLKLYVEKLIRGQNNLCAQSLFTCVTLGFLYNSFSNEHLLMDYKIHTFHSKGLRTNETKPKYDFHSFDILRP